MPTINIQSQQVEEKLAQLQRQIENLPKIPQSPVSSGRGCKEFRRSPALKSK